MMMCCCVAEDDHHGKPDLVKVTRVSNGNSKCGASLCNGDDEEPDVVTKEHYPSLLGQSGQSAAAAMMKESSGVPMQQIELQYGAEVPGTYIYNPVTETHEEVRIEDVQVEALPQKGYEPKPISISAPMGSAEDVMAEVEKPQLSLSRTATSTLSSGEHTNVAAPQQPEPVEFCVEIDKDMVKHGVGMEIQALDDMLIILRLRDGPLREWNASHNQPLQVAPGDRILSVNDTSSDIEALLQGIKGSTHLKLRIRRPEYFQIAIDKSGKGLGAALLVNTDPLGMLNINQLRDGALKDWNYANPSRQLRSGDRIVWVNGVQGKPRAMLDRVKKDSQLDMVLLRLR
mmetsp:Transcript_64412/g.153649  ORF Transcript_64412/g.153649 Transcript_64412/m.153649 type:complete len:343 (-) Transcript_64412:199-1227(-)